MSKTGPISQVEAFYIEHHYKSMEAQELADLLGRKVSTVKAHIKKHFGNKISAIKSGDHFARTKGAVVMTETASMLGDSTRRRKDQANKDCITKIKHD